MTVDRVRPYKADALAGAAKGTRDGSVRLYRADRLSFADLQSALLDEVANHLPELRVAGCRHFELACKCLEFERLVVFASDLGQDSVCETTHEENAQ